MKSDSIRLISEDILFEQQYKEFIDYVNITNYTINESIIISENLKDKIEFVKNIASIVKTNVQDLLKLVSNRFIFKFFSIVKWSLTKLFDLIKRGFQLYRDIINAIAVFISKNKVVKWTGEKLKLLDEYLNNHPKLKRIGGIIVAGLLIYIWFNMTFTGDVSYDFDMSTVLLALAGKFTLSELFSGPEGVKLLLLFATGLIGLSFPWPGPNSIKFVLSMVSALAKKANIKLKLPKF